MLGFFTYAFGLLSSLSSLTSSSSSSSSSSSYNNDQALVVIVDDDMLRNINYTLIALVVVYAMSHIMTWIKRALWICFFIQIIQLVQCHIATSDLAVGVYGYLDGYSDYVNGMKQMMSPFVEQLKVLSAYGVDLFKTTFQYCNDVFQKMVKDLQ